MKGSEKQIIWAEEIKSRVVAVLRDGMEWQREVDPDDTANIRQRLASMLDIASGFDGYAGEMIAMFKGFSSRENLQQDLFYVISKARGETKVCPAEYGELGKRFRTVFDAK